MDIFLSSRIYVNLLIAVFHGMYLRYTIKNRKKFRKNS